MQDIFSGFEWAVAPDYEWRDYYDDRGRKLEVAPGNLGSTAAIERAWLKHARGGPLLVKVMQKASDERHYSPLKQPVFAEFARLDYRDPEALRGFACQFGLLGVGSISSSVKLADPPRLYRAYGEPYLAWALEIVRMQEGLALVEAHDSHARKRRLKELMDVHLKDVKGMVAFDEGKKPKLVIEPVSLIGAMWLQLASTLVGSKRFEACKFCRRLFEISTDQTGKRSDRVFCSDACKTNEYRWRRRRAMALATEGLTVKEIAARVQTPEQTVKGWLPPSRTARKGAR